MQCKSCNEEVPAKFSKAISRNQCPVCDGEIIDPRLQGILNNLKVAMDEAKEFPDQIADWLFSNYGFKKYDPNEAPMFPNTKQPNQNNNHRKISVNRIDDGAVDSNSFDDDNKTEFAKRAGVKNLKRVIDQIKGGAGAADPSEFIEDDVDIEDRHNIAIQDENVAPLDRHGKQQLFGMFNGDDKLAQALELEKLKKLRNSIAGGGGFSRG